MLHFDQKVTHTYPDLHVGYVLATGVTVEMDVEGLTEKRGLILSSLREKIREIRELPEIRAFLGFLEQMKIDTRGRIPQLEKMERILRNDQVNNVIDSCALVSLQYLLPANAIDFEKVEGDAIVSFAGRAEEIQLSDGSKSCTSADEVVLKDSRKILATISSGENRMVAVSYKTSKVLAILWKVPGLRDEILTSALNDVSLYLRKYCGGHIEKVGTL